jgi:hypothetical protein
MVNKATSTILCFHPPLPMIALTTEETWSLGSPTSVLILFSSALRRDDETPSLLSMPATSAPRFAADSRYSITSTLYIICGLTRQDFGSDQKLQQRKETSTVHFGCSTPYVSRYVCVLVRT